MQAVVSPQHIFASYSSSNSFPASWGMQSFMDFSHVGPSYVLQFFINCLMDPLHRVPSFRNRVLQCGSTKGSQFLPENLFLQGLLSLGNSFCQEPAPVCSFPQSASTCSGVVASLGCRWISAALLTSMGCRGTVCLTMVFMGCRGICSGTWNTSPPPFFIDFGVCFSLVGCFSLS